MTRRVNDIDLGAFVIDRGVLCVNGDAALLFEGVDESMISSSPWPHWVMMASVRGSLAMVHVSDDGDVAYFHNVSARQSAAS